MTCNHSIKAQFLAFFRQAHGASTIEFAFSAVLLFTCIVGIMEVAVAFFISISLENAVLRASRSGITGNAGDGITREQQVREIIETNGFGVIDMEKVTIQTLIYESFSQIGQPEPFGDANSNGTYDAGETYNDVNGNGQWDEDVGQTGLGGSGDIVLYNISYPTRSITGFFDPILGAITHQATVAVRNEPY